LAFERAERETDSSRQMVLLTFVLVGGGPTGVELAGTLAEIANRTLHDEYPGGGHAQDPYRAGRSRADDPPVIPPSASGRRSNLPRRIGVEVREGIAVTHVDADGVLLGAERIRAATVLWTAGVAASPLIRTLGVPLDRAGRAMVEPDGSIPGHPEVFVAGDCGGDAALRRQAAARRGADGDAGGHARGADDSAASGRTAIETVRLP
jgi:NADH dehydrogenase